MCQHCGNETPCVHVCPQQAVDVDPATGVVGEMPQRCLGCRYCMAACPYHARYFNWWDPAWPAGMEKTLNPGVTPRMRGVVEKCNFCHGRWHAAKEQAAAAGKPDTEPVSYVPACVEACPTGAIHFGDLNDAASAAAKEAARAREFPPAGEVEHPAEDLLPVEEGMGARDRRRAPSGQRKGERPWLRQSDGKAIHRARRRRAARKAKFLLWMAPWAALLVFGLYAAGLCLVKGPEPDQHG